MEIFSWYLLSASIFAFVLFGVDKERAKRNLWRIPERTLILSAVFGGAPGALAGMYFFHHKTRKLKFFAGIPVILVIQILGILMIKSYMGIDFF